ncbi:unnamed protein product [Ectocarpus sp. CCAP 1310/34]|nr:unnamed protein product [Ectocarpus sp. CCAP 1310/34]
MVQLMVLLYNLVWKNEYAPRKVACKLLHDGIVGALEKEDRIGEDQPDSRKKRGCADHAFMVGRIIQGRKTAGKPTYCFFLDVKKAYDTVCRNELSKQSSKHGIKRKIWRVLKQMTECTKSAVMFDGELSKFFNIEHGVPQVGKGVKVDETSVPGLLFADDCVWMSDTAEGPQLQIDAAKEFADKGRLSANVKKSAVMVCNVDREKPFEYRWKWGVEELAVVDQYACLRVEIAKDGSYTRYSQSGTSIHASNLTSVRSVVVPPLEYAGEVWKGNKKGQRWRPNLGPGTLFFKNVDEDLGRLSTEVERLRGENGHLMRGIADAEARGSELELRLQAALKSKEIDAAAGAAREEALRATAEQARARADTMSQSLAEMLADKLQEASTHISELRTVLRQEVRRREAAEAEVSEAQGFAHMDGNSQAVRHLEGELHARGVAGTVGGGEAGRGPLREEEREDGRSMLSGGRARGRSEGGGKEEAGLLCARRRRVPQGLSSWKGGQRLFLAALAGLRAELRCVNTQLGKAKAENEVFVRHCTERVAVRVERLERAVRQAGQKQAEAQRQASEAEAAGAIDRKSADTLKRVVKGISSILLDRLAVTMPTYLRGGEEAGERGQEMLERGLEELTAAVTDALSKVKERAKQAVPAQPHGDSLAPGNGRYCMSTVDGMVWGERSKDDFNMLAQLQKIEAESKLQSLQARLDDMTEKYSRAIADQETVDSTPLREEQERAKQELARAARAHSGIVSALEVTLAAEKSHCQDLRLKLERQTREHQVALADVDQRLLQTQQELDEAQQALEQAQFALDRECARRARLDKKYSELEDRGLVSPRSVSPRSVSPRVRRPEATTRKFSGESERSQLAQATLPRPSSVRYVRTVCAVQQKCARLPVHTAERKREGNR